MPINGPTTDNREALVDTDFEADAFAHGPLLQPIVKIDSTAALTGSGSTATPLAVALSADAGNQVQFGTDDGLFVDADGSFLGTTISQFNGPPIDISVAPQTDIVNTRVLALNNVHPTKSMTFVVGVTAFIQARQGEGGNWTTIIDLDIDGGGFVNIRAWGRGELNVVGAANVFLDNQVWITTEYLNVTIAPATTEIWTFQNRLFTVGTTTGPTTSLLERGQIHVFYVGINF